MGNHRRLILVPQLPIAMRYQEWWPKAFEENLKEDFDEVVVLGTQKTVQPDSISGFSAVDASIKNELRQVRQYLEMDVTKDDFLFHFDLSFPGIFHSVLFHHRVARSAVFCHATALNRYDIFQSIRCGKWRSEKTHAGLYDMVLLATKYHKNKLKLPNALVLGSLPASPESITPERSPEPRTILYCSVSRPSNQKVDMTVEHEVRKITGEKIERRKFITWKGYYQFLDRCKFLLITSKEETYGYQVADAISRGCIPIAPRAYSYPELLPNELLYNPDVGPEEKAIQIKWIMEQQKDRQTIELVNDNAVKDFWNRLRKVING